MKIVTIEFDDGIKYDVHCDYQPFEPAERGPEAQYPGCGESYTPEKVFNEQNIDITDIVDNLDAWELIGRMVNLKVKK